VISFHVNVHNFRLPERAFVQMPEMHAGCRISFGKSEFRISVAGPLDLLSKERRFERSDKLNSGDVLTEEPTVVCEEWIGPSLSGARKVDRIG
jgi:hypothetical protein